MILFINALHLEIIKLLIRFCLEYKVPKLIIDNMSIIFDKKKIQKI